MNKNENTINILKQNISSNLDSQDFLVETKDLYIAFLEDNTCVICEEYFEDLGEYQKSILYNYFTGESISSKIIDKFPKVQIPHTKSFKTNDHLRGIIVPIELFLNNFIKRGLVSEKNIITTYNTINEYIKENPTFVNYVFEGKEKKLTNI